MNKLDEIIKIADIHVSRIQSAMKRMRYLFPISGKRVGELLEEELVWLELLVSRFGKLQDLIGSKIIDLFFEGQGENIDNFTALDKINKLEKIGIIEDSEIWKEMRKVRNHISHESPDNPELTAKYLNQIVDMVPQLIEILNRLKRECQS